MCAACNRLQPQLYGLHIAQMYTETETSEYKAKSRIVINDFLLLVSSDHICNLYRFPDINILRVRDRETARMTLNDLEHLYVQFEQNSRHCSARVIFLELP